MKIAITGASGALGRSVTDHVLATIPPSDLILATRNPSALSDYAERGVQVREADFERPATLAAAFAGADRLLLISTNAIGRRISQHRAAIDAAVAAGVRFTAYTSFPLPTDQDRLTPLEAEHLATEDHLRASSMEWCILRNFPYAEGVIGSMMEALGSGQLVTNTGSAGTAYVARADCAAAAAAVLTGSGHEGRTYDITGPQSLSADGLAAAFARVGGKPVAVVQADDETVAAGVAQATGAPLPVVLSMVGGIGRTTRAGVFAAVSQAVEQLTGRSATAIDAVLAPALGR
jgi:NAD(P)H dehydrogenase (quinone)